MNDEQKDGMRKFFRGLLLTLIGGCVGSIISVNYAVKAAMQQEVKSKASIEYVDTQNNKQDLYQFNIDRKQDKRIDDCEKTSKEMFDKIIDIWKAVGCKEDRAK